MSANWGQGSTRAWRKVREHVLERDHHTCQLQLLPECLVDATEVHHNGPGIAATGRRRSEAIDPEECVAACTVCHEVPTAAQRRAGQAARRGRRRPRVHPADAMSPEHPASAAPSRA